MTVIRNPRCPKCGGPMHPTAKPRATRLGTWHTVACPTCRVISDLHTRRARK